jgi:nucleoside-diphosphate-sugar epimerase
LKNNILLTGFNGFIGKALVAELQIINNLIYLGRRNPAKLDRFYSANIDSTSNYGKPLTSINTVIHCAARAHIMNDDAQDPLTEFRKVNTLGTLNLAKQAADAGVKRFIYISSIKVNGESSEADKPFKYDDKHNAQDYYGVSKSEAETALFELSQNTGMEIVIIRPPLVYGEGVKANFAALLKLVGKGLPLPFRCIKQNKRSMVSVYNLVDLIKTCIEHPKAANQVFLVSDADDLSTAQMVALMAKVQGKRNLALPVPVWCFKLVGKLLNKRDVIDRLTGSLQVDIEHTKTTLHWQPPYSVEHGFMLAAKKSATK